MDLERIRQTVGELGWPAALRGVAQSAVNRVMFFRVLKCVMVRDVELSLTPREFGLLHFLMRHKGLVVPKLDILQAVWDVHHDGADNLVEVYIRYLRRKVDVPFGRSAIQTVRGSGYRLASDGG